MYWTNDENELLGIKTEFGLFFLSCPSLNEGIGLLVAG